MSGAMISPSMHGGGGGAANQQLAPSHHHHQQHQLHPVPSPCSPTSPPHHHQHHHQQVLATHLVANQDGSGIPAGSEVLGLPNVPVSPAHSPNVQGLHSNSLSSSSSQYDEINRILREAHFSRVSRLNGVELRPDELHL